MKLLVILLAFSQFAFAGFGTDNLKRMNWDGLEVVWLEDDRFPTYNVMIYFADGALNESMSEKGSTEAALQLLKEGCSHDLVQKVLGEQYDLKELTK